MDIGAVRDFELEPVNHAYTFKDTILYALGLGYGSDPLDPSELTFVYEQDLKTVPSICGVLAHPGFWAKDPKYGIDWVKILHGEQSYEIHGTMPTEGKVRGRYSIDAAEDKGAERGAILYQTKRLYDDADNLLATVRSTLFLRGDGGHGGFGEAPAAPEPIAHGPVVASFEAATLPQQALIYRLSGDFNPIHADPAPAKKAGFERPILHGLCTLGIATRAAIQTFAPGAPEKLTSMFVRFSKPVFPGETIVTDFYREGDAIRFRCRAKERDIVVLDRGNVVFAN